MRTASSVRLVAALAMVWSCAATAEIYKWVDQKGVTNYGSAPPGKARAKLVDAQSAMVSVYAAPPPPQAALALETAMRDRIARLESELLAERRARQTQAASAQSESDRRLLAYEQCTRDRRVDCDQAYDGGYFTPPYYAAAPVYVLARPAAFRSKFPPRQFALAPGPLPAFQGGAAGPPGRGERSRRLH